MFYGRINVNRSEWHKFLPGRLSSKAFKQYARLYLEECRNYDVVKKRTLEYFGQNEQVCLNPFPTVCGRERRTDNRVLTDMKDTHERREGDCCKKVDQGENQKQKLKALRRKQKRKREFECRVPQVLENVAIANALQLEAARCRAVPIPFIFVSVPSLNSLSLSVAVLELFTAHTLRYA